MLRMSMLLIGVALSFVSPLVSPGSAQEIVLSGDQYVCPKCGQVHSRNGHPSNSDVIPVSYIQSSNTYGLSQGYSSTMIGSTLPSPAMQSTQLQGTGGVTNVLSTLNAQRARSGIGALSFDPTLQAVAEQRAALMASRGIKNHPPGSFSPGRYEGVGWSSSYSPSGVSACFTNDGRMRSAGAAMATGRDGVYFCVVYQ